MMLFEILRNMGEKIEETSSSVKQFVKETQEDIGGMADSIKNNCIQSAKEVCEPAGKALEHIDRLGTTILNVHKEMSENKIVLGPPILKSLVLKRINDDQCEIGDHVSVSRLIYSHHGIYIGDGMIIHYDGGSVCKISIDDFKQGGLLTVVPSGKSYTNEEILYRAKGRLYESEYHLIFNNCEHFARWCRSGDDCL